MVGRVLLCLVVRAFPRTPLSLGGGRPYHQARRPCSKDRLALTARKVSTRRHPAHGLTSCFTFRITGLGKTVNR